jgi:protein TonB
LKNRSRNMEKQLFLRADSAVPYGAAVAAMSARRVAAFRMLGNVLASCAIHGGVVAALVLFSGARPEAPQETVYRIALADAAFTRADASVSPGSMSAAPESAPVVATPQAQPAVAPAPAREKPVIARKEKAAAKSETAEAPMNHAAASPDTLAEAASSGNGPVSSVGGTAVYEEGAVDQPPSVAVRIVPDYPQRARRLRVEGRVAIRLVVDSAGNPQGCAVHKADPVGYFEEAALAATGKTRFIPGKLHGRPVNTLAHISFVFVLR